MSISLIGIVAVQLYWINNTIESRNIQFRGDVKKALARVSERLEVKEEAVFYNKIESFIKTKRFLNKAQIKNFLIQQIDTTSKSRFSFGTTIIEEDFKIPVLDILEKNGFYDNDSIVVKRLTKKRDFFKGTFISGDNDFIQLQKMSNVKQFSPITKKLVTTDDPHRWTMEKIFKGCGSDAVPNILSPDNAIAEGIRQKPMTKKRMDDWYNSEDPKMGMDEETYKNFCL